MLFTNSHHWRLYRDYEVHHHDYDHLYTMFHMWVTEVSNPTWEDLINALERSHNYFLAQEIEEAIK